MLIFVLVFGGWAAVAAWAVTRKGQPYSEWSKGLPPRPPGGGGGPHEHWAISVNNYKERMRKERDLAAWRRQSSDGRLTQEQKREIVREILRQRDEGDSFQ